MEQGLVPQQARKHHCASSTSKPKRKSKSPLLQWAFSTVSTPRSDTGEEATSWSKWLQPRRERTEGPIPAHQQEMLVSRLTALRTLPQAARVKHRPCGRTCVLIRPGKTSSMDRCEHTSVHNIARFLHSMDHLVQSTSTSGTSNAQASSSRSVGAVSSHATATTTAPLSSRRQSKNGGLVKPPRASSGGRQLSGGGGASRRPSVSRPHPVVVGFSDV